MRSFSFSGSSEAPTHSNSGRAEKLRQDDWLISAILREINHLENVEEPAFRPALRPEIRRALAPD
jgi:hypothetical protein